MAVNVKICGITRPEDAALAAELGATHLSCVLTAGTALSVTSSTAREVQLAAGKKVKLILSFRTPALEAVLEASKAVGTRHVQITGLKEPELVPFEKAGLVLYRVHEVPTGANLLPPLTPAPTEKAPATLQVSAAGARLTFPLEILGNEGLGWAGTEFGEEQLDVTRLWLFSKCYSIYGGSHEVQNNITASRELNLPKG